MSKRIYIVAEKPAHRFGKRPADRKLRRRMDRLNRVYDNSAVLLRDPGTNRLIAVVGEAFTVKREAERAARKANSTVYTTR